MNRAATAILLISLSVACTREVAVDLLPGEGAARVLRFAGPYDHVEIASSTSLDVPHDFAVEAWVFIETYAGGHGVFNRWQPAIGDIQLTFGVPEPIPAAELPAQDVVPSHTLAAWGYVATNATWITAYSRDLPEVGHWHHLAMSYGGGSLKLYVDGALAATAPGTEPISNAPTPLFIGATARTERPFADGGQPWWPPLQGAIADVRMSSVDRYPTNFAPQRHLSVDDATLALWHLDEGAGRVALDSGPNHLDGAIAGAAWSALPSR